MSSSFNSIPVKFAGCASLTPAVCRRRAGSCAAGEKFLRGGAIKLLSPHRGKGGPYNRRRATRIIVLYKKSNVEKEKLNYTIRKWKVGKSISNGLPSHVGYTFHRKFC
ncbi:hypothetical protein EVAR_47413_1 [Eumeta japonica]|uniref:Uncharacterized protein n=1 Tax=Eumeta variegata TaxID=151549 RepID=A0A4C1XZU5_EUMVA|nr:hypothetical protein EVAR_47413_1 [Eumeta japonica]